MRCESVSWNGRDRTQDYLAERLFCESYVLKLDCPKTCCEMKYAERWRRR